MNLHPEDPRDDGRLDDAGVALLCADVADEAVTDARRSRVRRQLLRRVAAAQHGHLTVAVDDDRWQPFTDGVRIKVLHEADGVMAYLLRFAPGASIGAHRHPIDEECVVLEGSLRIGDDLVVHAGGFHLARGGTLHAAIGSDTGATIYLRGAVPEVADLL
jgi:quercetin dioxygenase-like cupin family protein